MKREKKDRLRYFAMDVDAFLDDDRTQRLSDGEQGQWLLLLVKMWRLGGRMPDDALFISRAIGIPFKKALAFKAKFEGLKLLVHDGGNYLESPRMVKEYAIARAAYEQPRDAGRKSAEARKKAYGTAQPLRIVRAVSNAVRNAVANDTRTDSDRDLDLDSEP